MAIYINLAEMDVQEKATENLLKPFPNAWFVTVVKRPGKMAVISERSPKWPPGVLQYWGFLTKSKNPKEILPSWGDNPLRS